MLPSGTLPLTASGPRAMFPVHPASHRKHTLARMSRDLVGCEVCWIIGSLLLCSASVSPSTGRRRCAVAAHVLEIVHSGAPSQSLGCLISHTSDPYGESSLLDRRSGAGFAWESERIAGP